MRLCSSGCARAASGQATRAPPRRTRQSRRRMAWPPLLVSNFPLFTNRRVQIVTLAVRQGIPMIATQREFAEAGGLMSYGSNLADSYRQMGIYAGRILKGARPADLPVVQSSKFELVINAETARMLGLTVPPTLLSVADEVIE